MFNANCQAAVVISHLKYALKMPSNSIIDLLPYPTVERGPTAPIGINEKPQDQYCDQFLQPRGTYILLQAKLPHGSEGLGDDLNTPGAVGLADRAGSAGPNGAVTAPTREMMLVWSSPNPDETERIALMLAQRNFEPKKPVTKKAGKK